MIRLLLQQLSDFTLITGQYLRENPVTAVLYFYQIVPRTWLTALTSLSLANSICPFPHLFSGTTSKIKNFSLIPAFSYYIP